MSASGLVDNSVLIQGWGEVWAAWCLPKRPCPQQQELKEQLTSDSPALGGGAGTQPQAPTIFTSSAWRYSLSPFSVQDGPPRQTFEQGIGLQNTFKTWYLFNEDYPKIKSHVTLLPDRHLITSLTIFVKLSWFLTRSTHSMYIWSSVSTSKLSWQC